MEHIIVRRSTHMVDRYPWLPKFVIRAFKNDARRGIVQHGQLEKVYKRFLRLSQVHPSPRLRQKYSRIATTIKECLVPRLRAVKRTRGNYETYREEAKVLNNRLKMWRETKARPTEIKEDLYDYIQILGAIRLTAVKDMQQAYPNSSKQCPHAGWAVWNGSTHNPWTVYWSETLKCPSLWDLKPIKFRDEAYSDESYLMRKEEHEELYEGINPDNRIWVTGKYKHPVLPDRPLTPEEADRYF